MLVPMHDPNDALSIRFVAFLLASRFLSLSLPLALACNVGLAGLVKVGSQRALRSRGSLRARAGFVDVERRQVAW